MTNSYLQMRDELREEHEALRLMSYHGTNWGGMCADIEEDDIESICALLRRAGEKLSEAGALYEEISHQRKLETIVRSLLAEVSTFGLDPLGQRLAAFSRGVRARLVQLDLLRKEPS